MLVPKLIRGEPVILPIDTPWVIDVLDERFDDAISMLDSYCIIYGGAVRDALADIKIEGDLDILVPEWGIGAIYNNFSTSARWTECAKKNSGDANSSIGNLISKVYTFVNANNVEVQLISPLHLNSATLKDYPLDVDCISVVKAVDIRCCGVSMDTNGKVFEVVEGAFDDCQKKVLTLNIKGPITKTKLNHLSSRIKKFETRGWKNNININKITVKG